MMNTSKSASAMPNKQGNKAKPMPGTLVKKTAASPEKKPEKKASNSVASRARS
jgi:hypothetical protein